MTPQERSVFRDNLTVICCGAMGELIQLAGGGIEQGVGVEVLKIAPTRVPGFAVVGFLACAPFTESDQIKIRDFLQGILQDATAGKAKDKKMLMEIDDLPREDQNL